MRLLLLLCLHWSGTMKQVALRPEQQQGEQEQEQKQQAAADGLQPNASAADDYELCKFLTARLAGLLLQVTRRELQLYVGSAVFGAVASSVAGGSQQRLKERGMQTESSKHQWQQSLELQHLLAVVLQQEQQKESVEISALFFLADTSVLATCCCCGIGLSLSQPVVQGFYVSKRASNILVFESGVLQLLGDFNYGPSCLSADTHNSRARSYSTRFPRSLQTGATAARSC